ncbi:PepSY domain-containing protein [Massilia sp. PAMC28688]|uniref:PepSY-associated TM helix domain-containing protein n=1 Tax=Massilia sp. PAMC28688 TaxID=2861283 RepID=UPI001C62A00D|nr:PepSY-associated TM helix domain-containing protein [Massilia sp. PAMC28688]QYF92999.1 PepSY domain-containing protein [Massilia sp. PAMC28688]
MAQPQLGWPASLAAARRALAAVATRENLQVINEDRLMFDPRQGTFRLAVRTDRDINDRYGHSSIYIDARTGRLLGYRLPTGQAAGDTITSWITTLHMASIWGIPFRIVITLSGLAVALLSVTGVLIWWKEPQACRAAMPSLPAISDRALGPASARMTH